jgi:AAA+ superfamily predicted ATPase
VSPIDVVVASMSGGYQAEVIASAVAARPDMRLTDGRYVALTEVDDLLAAIPAAQRCALVLVGLSAETGELAERWLAERSGLVVLYVETVDDVVRIALRDPRLDSLLGALLELVESVGTQPRERVARVELHAVPPPLPEPELPPAPDAPSTIEAAAPAGRPLLDATVDWVRAVLRHAVERFVENQGDVHGFAVSRASILQSLGVPAVEPAEPADEGGAEAEAAEPPEAPAAVDATEPLDLAPSSSQLAMAEAALDEALAAADANEPLSRAARVLLDADGRDYRLLGLALAPELDHRFQRCMGFLLDEMGRRVGTLGLYQALLGATTAHDEIVERNAFARWLLVDGYPSRPPAADEPLRLDPFLAQWLLGERAALADDPRVRRLLRAAPWPGEDLLDRPADLANAESLAERLAAEGATPWLLLGGDDPAAWRALLERGTQARGTALLRVEPTRLAAADLVDVEESALRVGRLARLTGGLLAVDVASAEESAVVDDSLRTFFATLARTRCRAAVIGADEARLVRLLGDTPHQPEELPALAPAARVAAIRAAARRADAYLTEEAAEAMASRYPLHLDGLEHAVRLAEHRPLDYAVDDPRLARFTAACKQVAAEGISSLAERIEPIFSLDDVVLPADRSRQLVEIVDNVRLAPRVLDGWRFGDQLPYGRGVSALFFGPSGTGKTMAAMGIARQLGVQVLRLDFSRVVSKYIGDTEKNLDRVFTDAQRSGAAILIDEADALLGKRSEVKDAHDRYANIEVAYLLQRMEAYEGLAILTTNMRQNLDAAFLRRLRFLVEFSPPDVEARERIWRQCLPAESHQLDDAAFRQLARRINVTGGHIRQITLRAAFVAASAGERIGLEQVAHAARAELAKLGMAPVELDLGTGRQAA